MTEEAKEAQASLDEEQAQVDAQMEEKQQIQNMWQSIATTGAKPAPGTKDIK